MMNKHCTENNCLIFNQKRDYQVFNILFVNVGGRNGSNSVPVNHKRQSIAQI